MLALLLPASASAEQATRIIVQHDPGLSSAERRDIRTDADVRLVETLPLPRTEVVAAAPGDVQAALHQLNADPDVVYAEPDRQIQAFGTAPNDPDFDLLWGYENLGDFTIGADHAVADADMDVTDAWGFTSGAGRTVAVVDSGVDTTHPDLAGDRIAGGWDFVDSDPYPTDPNGHGTHVAGTIAATANNHEGIAGVAPAARIMPLRVLGANGKGLVSDAIKAYDFAAEHGVSIVNLSLGNAAASQAEYDAIRRHPGVLFVAAAGNHNPGDDATPDYPCAYDLTNIVCVGASRHDDKPAEFSDWDPTSVDVFAPGYSIYSTVPGGGYDYKSGTSMAAPAVSAGAALLLSRLPSLAPEDVKAALIEESDPADPELTGKSVSNGRVNLKDSLRFADADGDDVPDITDNCPSEPNPGQEDGDNDGVGDACIAPGSDPDGDLKTAADNCPDEYAPYAADGCPGNGPNTDTDDWPDSFDACPTADGTARGCPDADSDGVRDSLDNCPTRANANQSDVDHDSIGDVCDPTPRGPDADGDGKPLLDDACPTVYALTANGCPVVVPGPIDSDGDGTYNASDSCPYEYAKTRNGCPLPSVTSLSARAKKRHGKRSATISVRTSRAASVEVTIQRKVCKHKRCRWVRVSRKHASTVSGRATVTATKLKRGSYRAVVVLSSSAGRTKAETQRFRVR